MKKSRRYLLFGFGIALGCMLVYFTLIKGKNRAYWLPSNRVKEMILTSKITYADQVKCLMDCKNISESGMTELIRSGDVNFQESDTRKTPPSYMIDGTLAENKKIRIIISTVDSISKIHSIDLEKDTCGCR